MESNNTHSHLKQFNETIGIWISFLSDYTIEMLCQKPKTDSWSLGQVYSHIIDDTEYFVKQMKASLINKENSEKEMHEDARAIFRNRELPDTMLNGPATNAYIRQPASKDELLQSLVLIKEEVNRLCAEFDFSASTGKTQHPGLLFFNAAEWLQFAEMHMRHHFRQKKRIDDKLFSHI